MTGYILEIKLLSPLSSAAGEGRVGLVDRDIAFDDFGLPILPSRRLKGLWREAYRDVTDAWQQSGEACTPIEKIFGDSGGGYGDGDACMHITNAELENASSLKKWLEYLQHHKIGKLHAEDVVQQYATVRAQTAIDRKSGAAKENTLRFTRTLKPGYVFRAPVRFTATPNTELENALALGAAALQHMGTARTRGLGRIQCRFLKLDNGSITDLTPKPNQCKLPSIDGACVTQSPQNLTQQTTTFTGSMTDTPTHILRYRLTLKEAAIIPVADGDPNTVVTRQDIPGSHLWGAAAWHYLNQPNHAPTDSAFCCAFLNEGLRFLTAYPEIKDPNEFEEKPQRTIPIPHSIRKKKSHDSLVDFVVKPPQSLNDEQTKRHERRYGRINSGRLDTLVVKTDRNYHHARAATDRRIGRALGSEVGGADAGALFAYEAIQAGQTFQGAVLGSEEDLTNLKNLLEGVNVINVGRSRSAQYGKAEFEWIKDVQPLGELVESEGFFPRQTLVVQINPGNEVYAEDDWDESEEWNENVVDGIVEGQHFGSLTLDKQLVITTLSPLLSANEHGHPEARFPERELSEILGLDISKKKPKLLRSYTRTELVSGYNTHLRLPRQQVPAIAAGSVFVFDIEDIRDCIDVNNLLKLEYSGLGLRKGEGYGRLAINHLKLNNQEERKIEDPEHQPSVTRLEGVIPEPVQELLRGVVKTQCLSEMQQRAIDAVNEYKVSNIPSNALIGRLLLFLQQDPHVASKNLNNLANQAEKKLKACQIDTSEGNTSWLSRSSSLTLYDLFETAWNKPEELIEKPDECESFWTSLLTLIKSYVEQFVDSSYANESEKMINELVKSDIDEMCKAFLNHLLTALYRQ